MSNTKLYKYLDADGGIKMLQNSNLQFTNATRLNDPFDCHPAIFDFSKVPFNKNKWPPADFIKKKGILDMENLRNSAWICSLSKVHDSLLMWAYYGNHKGICIGVDMEKANKYLSQIHCEIYIGAIEMEVQYKDIIVKPDYYRDTKDYFHYLLSTKAKVWEHEQEVRLLLIDPTPAGVTYHPCFATMALLNQPKDPSEVIDWKEVRAYPHIGGECFDSLYLGINIDKEKKNTIVEFARKRNLAIKIYQMAPDPNAFRIKAVLQEQ